MRIAVSGTHFSGKSALVEALSGALPSYDTVEEPYHLMEEEGYEFPGVPSFEDFELQLQRSLESLSGSGPDVIFDRCPIDLLGYLLTHHDADAFRLEEWMPRVRPAIEKLDLIVYLPVERPDRITVPSSQDKSFRLEVDEKLKELLMGNSTDLNIDVLEVTGALDSRVEQVLTYLRERGADVTGRYRPAGQRGRTGR
ncbi:MAG: ATP-binding protein [Acidobacteriia bacterium]|nr:ATP-binding protein [Terriglobia bacterium]